MSHVTYDWVMSHINESRHTSTSHVTHQRVMPHIPPKNGKIALQTPRTGRLSTFEYCQVVNRHLLRFLSTYILVYYRVLVNYNIKLTKILYHWLLSMDSIRFGEAHLLHIKLFVGNKNAISPFLGGTNHATHQRVMPHINESCHTSTSHATYQWVMSHINESCHTSMNHATHQQVMPHINESCRTSMSHATHQRVMSQTNESCHTSTKSNHLRLGHPQRRQQQYHPHTHAKGQPRRLLCRAPALPQTTGKNSQRSHVNKSRRTYQSVMMSHI